MATVAGAEPIARARRVALHRPSSQVWSAAPPSGAKERGGAPARRCPARPRRAGSRPQVESMRQRLRGRIAAHEADARNAHRLTKRPGADPTRRGGAGRLGTPIALYPTRQPHQPWTDAHRQFLRFESARRQATVEDQSLAVETNAKGHRHRMHIRLPSPGDRQKPLRSRARMACAAPASSSHAGQARAAARLEHLLPLDAIAWQARRAPQPSSGSEVRPPHRGENPAAGGHGRFPHPPCDGGSVHGASAPCRRPRRQLRHRQAREAAHPRAGQQRVAQRPTHCCPSIAPESASTSGPACRGAEAQRVILALDNPVRSASCLLFRPRGRPRMHRAKRAHAPGWSRTRVGHAFNIPNNDGGTSGVALISAPDWRHQDGQRNSSCRIDAVDAEGVMTSAAGGPLSGLRIGHGHRGGGAVRRDLVRRRRR